MSSTILDGRESHQPIQFAWLSEAWLGRLSRLKNVLQCQLSSTRTNLERMILPAANRVALMGRREQKGCILASAAVLVRNLQWMKGAKANHIVWLKELLE
jgi:hypothetical protein